MLPPDPDEYVTTEEPENDLRWDLLRKLAERANGQAPHMALRGRRVRPGFAFPYSYGGPPDLRQPLRIVIDSDARVPLTFLIAELKAFWQAMRKLGEVPERNRTLERRKVELLEFVCLTHPDLSWNDRRAKWNALTRVRRRGWGYGSPERFITEVHTAEEQLTGSRSGLRWFYEPLARMSVSELAQRDDADAKRELERRKLESGKAIEETGIPVVREKVEVQRGKRRR